MDRGTRYQFKETKNIRGGVKKKEKDKEMKCYIEQDITQSTCMYFSILSEDKARKRNTTVRNNSPFTIFS